jgi:ketosteroid isomerase-like protein
MPNVRSLVETYYETYGRHDIDGLLAMMDDNVRIHFPVDEEPKTNKEQIRAAWTLSFNVVIPDIRQELHTIVADGNHAAVQFTEYGTVRIPEDAARTGGLAVRPRPYAMEMASFYTFSSRGLISEIRSFWDTGNFARQLGIDIGIIQAMSRGSTQVLSRRLPVPPARRPASR